MNERGPGYESAALLAPAASGWSRVPVLCLLLALAVLLAYARVGAFDYVAFDDRDYVSLNPHVQAGLTGHGLAWAFRTGHAGNWHPLTWLSHMLDAQCFGRGAAGPHRVNAGLHAANACLVFLLLWRLTGARWRSLLVAALFALHPLRVESVVWISERKDVLSSFFGLLALLAYVRWVTESKVQGPKSKVWYGAALVCFALGLLSKPMLVTLPCVLLLLDYWPLNRVPDFAFRLSSWRSLLVEKIPFFALSAAACVVTFLAQRQSGTVSSLEEVPLPARGANALVSVARYLGKAVWPTDLAVLYPYPGGLPVGVVVGALGLVGAITALAFWQRRARPYLLVGWLWFLGMLVPVIGLVQVGMQSMADRYTYLPSVGLFVALVWSLDYWLEREEGSRFLAALIQGTAGLAVVALGITTFVQTGHWRNGETLARRAISVTQNNYVAWNVLGAELANHGKLAEALDCYRQALRIKPNFVDALYNLGNALLALGQVHEAITAYREALRVNPKLAEALTNLGNAYDRQGNLEEAAKLHQQACDANPAFVEAPNNLGNVLVRLGRPAEAKASYRRALELNPSFAEAYNNLGFLLAREGQTSEARSCYQRAVAARPEYPEAQNNLGLLLAAAGQLPAAIKHYQIAVKLNPNFAEAWNNLARTLEATGDLTNALPAYENVVRLRPQADDARSQFAVALGRLGKFEAAAEQFQIVLRAHPDDVRAHSNLAFALVRLEQFPPAIEHSRESVRLAPDDAAAQNNLGYALLQAGRAGEAVTPFREALRLNPTFATAAANLGETLATIGQFAEAEVALETAVKLSPDNPEFHFQLGGVCAALNKRTEAISHFETALRLRPEYPAATNRLRAEKARLDATPAAR